MKSKVYVGPSLRRNDAIECARAPRRWGEGGKSQPMMFIKSPIQLRKISLLAGIFISSFSIHTGLRSKNSSTGAFAMKTEKSHFFFFWFLFFLYFLFLFPF